MQLAIEDRPEGYVHAKLAGHMDVPGTNAIATQLQNQVPPRRKNAVLDLAEVDYIGSLGIGQLVAVATSLRRLKLRAVLVGTRPELAAMLRATRVDTLLPMFDTLDQALASFKPAG
jgi:anti-sigma B factor antagonist